MFNKHWAEKLLSFMVHKLRFLEEKQFLQLNDATISLKRNAENFKNLSQRNYENISSASGGHRNRKYKSA